MKNRLVEKLMTENSRLREEMETAMSRKSPNISIQEDFAPRIAGLELQLEELKANNKDLTDELKKKSENKTLQEAEIKKLEENMHHFVQKSRLDMEEPIKENTHWSKLWKLVGHQVPRFKNKRRKQPKMLPWKRMMRRKESQLLK